jgi:uracil-DNA glycosylase
MPDNSQRADLAAMLAWYRDMGIDAALADETVNWLETGGAAPGGNFRLGGAKAPIEMAHTAALAAAPQPRRDSDDASPASRPAARSPISPAAPAVRQFPTAAPDAATMAAREIARSAATIDALHQALAGFQGCGLRATAKNLCFYRGSPRAPLMIVGEAPGREEDLEGKPFIGRAGQLLDKMLASIGLAEADVHITNIVYWRPPGNRTPTPQEAQICRPFLDRQMELVAPKVVLTLGGPATGAVLGVEGGIMKSRGRWREIEIEGRAVRAMPTLHPAYLLRTPAAKRLTWRDLLAVRAALVG